jgi:hypothetical protein
MSKRTYPKPEGERPRANQVCPLCNAPAHVAHHHRCPWKLWADSPAPASPSGKERGE